jgi:hypothetical protein
MNNMQRSSVSPAILPGKDGGLVPCPSVMTEKELIRFLRIPQVSNPKNRRNVVENLKRSRNLPRIRLCRKTVYLTDAVKAWLENHITSGQ